jgi:hypothetical protein
MFNIDNPHKEKEQKGVWGKFQGSEFLVRHIGNFDFQRSFSRLQLPYRKKIEKGSLDPETTLDIMVEAMSIGLLVDWRHVSDKSGEEIPYSRELAVKALTNNVDLREWVQDFATDIENFKEVERDELGKASKTT